MLAGPRTRQTVKRFSCENQTRTCPVVRIIGIMWWVEAMGNSKSRFKEERGQHRGYTFSYLSTFHKAVCRCNVGTRLKSAS